MKRIELLLLAAIGLLSASWLLSDTLWPQPLTYFSFRAAFMQYSGVIAIGVMSLAMLLVLALVRRFPYHLFARTHKWIAVAYLALVFHSVVLMNFGYWSQPVGPLMALLMAGGSGAAVVSLLRKVGARRRALGAIEELVHHPDNRVLKVAIR